MGLLFYLVAFWIVSAIYHEWLSPRRQRRRRQLKLLAHQLRDRIRWERDRLSPAELEWREQRLAEATALRRTLDREEEIDILLMRMQLPEIARHSRLQATWAGPACSPAARKFYNQAAQTAEELIPRGSPEAVKRFALNHGVREQLFASPALAGNATRAALVDHLLAPATQAEATILRHWPESDPVEPGWQAWLSPARYRRLIAGSSPAARLRRLAANARLLQAAEGLGLDEATRQRLAALAAHAGTLRAPAASVDQLRLAAERLDLACQAANLRLVRFWYGDHLGEEGNRLCSRLETEAAALSDSAETASDERLVAWQQRAGQHFAVTLCRVRLQRWSASLSSRDAKWLDKLVADLDKAAGDRTDPAGKAEGVLAHARAEAGKDKNASGAASTGGGMPDWLPLALAVVVIVVVSRAAGSRLGLMAGAAVFGIGWAVSEHRRGRLMPRVMHLLKTGVPEFVELVIVVFGVVAGLRGLFIQPFKIPTGSMQPTLYGIHYQPDDRNVKPGLLGRALDYVNYSYRYAEQVARQPGSLDPYSVRQANPLLLFPETRFKVGEETYRLPGDIPHTVGEQQGYAPYRPDHVYKEGEVIARGRLLMGDHLFVDRVSYNFTEPRRGEVAVFITDDIKLANGASLGGRYYIKRLVGLPGDTLRIADRHLYVKPRGETEFKPIEELNPALAKLYSFRGGYRGHSHARIRYGAQYLTHDDDTFTLEDDEYFMLGDNTENSQDSRYWGPVPRSHLVGRACFVWWPFSRRWGPVDKAPPEDYPSPPTER